MRLSDGEFLTFTLGMAATVFVGVLLIGDSTASPSAPPPVAPVPPAGMSMQDNFFPTYLSTLRGEQPGQTDGCQARDLQDLFIPCDKGGSP